MSLFHLVLIKLSKPFINTVFLDKINQYSTGLFVSYSVKTQLHEKCFGQFTALLTAKAR
jgi:hypothetical protein